MKSIESTLHDYFVQGVLTDEQRQSIYDMAIEQYKDEKIQEEMKPKKKTPAQLRKKYPALQDAYEQYRMVLKLVEQEDLEE